MASVEPYPSPPASPKAPDVDPVLRNALRYTISAKEYKTLHEYLIIRSKALRDRAPPPARVSSILTTSDDHHAATIRASLRVFIASQTGLQIWDLITTQLWGRGKAQTETDIQSARVFFLGKTAFEELGLLVWQAYGDFILSHTPNYLQRRPQSYPAALPWPDPSTIVDSLAEMSRLHWPPFTSPILFPSNPNPLPSSLVAVSPITSPAHPSIPHLSCALLHPSSPSCSKTLLTYTLTAFPSLAKFFTLIFALLSLPRYKAFLSNPSKELNGLSKRVLRMTIFIMMAIGTSWASICLFANAFPRNFLSTQRWFVGGFLGGLWAFLDRQTGRSNFLYSVRLSIDSAWKVGKKRRWWSAVKGGDLAVFVMALGVVNAVYEKDPAAVQGGLLRKGLGILRGEGWTDRAEKEGKETFNDKSKDI
ncbi:MAG: hypothetical protein Q9194_001766 [Teloschistes cf. exilis]